jgi:hypothetical protein
MYNVLMLSRKHLHFLIATLTVACFSLAACMPETGKIQPTATVTLIPVTAKTLPSATITPVPLTPIPTLPQNTPIIVDQPTVQIPTELAEDLLDQKFPIAQLNIIDPGPDSKIASPLQISAYAFPGADGKVTLQLWGEDGRLMADQLIKLKATTSGVTFVSQIPFEITAGGESAVVTLTSFDSSGRRIAVNSVPLTLMQIGNSSIETGGFAKQPFVLTSPAANSTVSGGILHLTGYAHPFSQAPLIVELIKDNGSIVASKQIKIAAPDPGQNYAAFSFDLSYSVSEATSVRISLRQGADHAPLIDLALSSQLVTLQP